MELAGLASHRPFPQKHSVSCINSHPVNDLESTDNILYLTACYTHCAEEKTTKSQVGTGARDENKAADKGANWHTARRRQDYSGNLAEVDACKYSSKVLGYQHDKNPYNTPLPSQDVAEVSGACITPTCSIENTHQRPITLCSHNLYFCSESGPVYAIKLIHTCLFSRECIVESVCRCEM